MAKDNTALWIILGSAVALALFSKGEEIIDFAVDKVSDLVSENKIKMLHPLIRDKARQFINAAEKKGIKLRVTSSLRTFNEQNDLYAQGRTTPGNIVTNAKAGQSSHNFGTAIDVVPIVNGKADYNTSRWNEIGQLGKSFGFSWGGDWTGLVDKPHFEMNFGNSLAQLLKKYNDGNISDGYVKLA